jgi:uroporphyrin-3 C-methyltransferase
VFGLAQPPLAPPAGGQREHPAWWWVGAGVVALCGLLALSLAWQTQQKLNQFERELVRRHDATAAQAGQASATARQSQDQVRDALARVAVLDARVAEVAVQRAQIEELIASLSRSRDENVLVDIEAGLRVAMQQSAITGSAEPLVAMLRQSDERLARYKQPRLEGVRRAIARDLDRARSVAGVDVSSLAIRLDEAIRLMDEVPLVSSLASSSAALKAKVAPPKALPAQRPAPGPDSPLAEPGLWPQFLAWLGRWPQWAQAVWQESSALLRVTRIDHPEAMLNAPEQAYFVRENTKLRLLNARLALLSRQFDTAQSDIQAAHQSLERYFDPQSRRYALVSEAMKAVSGQARQVVLPRPDDTLAALSAAGASR